MRQNKEINNLQKIIFIQYSLRTLFHTVLYKFRLNNNITSFFDKSRLSLINKMYNAQVTFSIHSIAFDHTADSRPVSYKEFKMSS